MIDEQIEYLILKVVEQTKRIADALDRAVPVQRLVVQPPPSDDAVTSVTPQMRSQWQNEDDEVQRRNDRMAEERLIGGH